MRQLNVFKPYINTNVVKPSNTTNVVKPSNNANVFKPYNEEDVYTLSNICIETDPSGRKVSLDPDTNISRKILVAYNRPKSGWTKLKAATAGHAKICYSDWPWDILETNKSIPITHTYITEYPAYFTTPSFISNLAHFWSDFLVGMYGVLNATNMLGVTDGSQLYMKGWEWRYGTWGWFNSTARKERYKDLIYPLGVRKDYYIYHNETPNTCYKSALFGWKPVPSKYLVDYLNTKLPFDSAKCKVNQITLIQRTIRKIINIKQLKQVAIKLGFTNISIVYFERLTVLGQYQLVRCTDILIGINGAALQWALFMKPKSGLVELYYSNFKVFYNKYHGHNGLVYRKLIAEKQIKNWDTYKLLRHRGHGGELSKSQKQKIKFLGKDCDGIFNSKKFKTQLAGLAHVIFQ